MHQGLQDQQIISYLQNKYLNDAISLPVVIDETKSPAMKFVNTQPGNKAIITISSSILIKEDFRFHLGSIMIKFSHVLQSSLMRYSSFGIIYGEIADVHRNSQAGWISNMTNQLHGVSPQQKGIITYDKVVSAVKKLKSGGLLHTKFLDKVFDQFTSQIGFPISNYP